MARKWVLLNILLLVAVIGLARELSRQYDQLNARIDPAKIEPISTENQAAAKTATGASVDTSVDTPVATPFYAEDDYFIISEKTLFSDLRGREAAVGPVITVVSPVPPLNPRPILVSTIMIDGQYTASVIDPARQQARSAELNTETRRVGDSYRGYEITSIDAEQMVLENGGRREVIQINRSARRLQPVRPAAAMASAARVVRIGPGGAASGAVSIATAGAVAQPGRPTQNPAQNIVTRQGQTPVQVQPPQNQPAAAGRGAVVSVGPVEPAAPATENAQPKAKAKPAQKPQQGAGAVQQQQQRVIRSPFGDIIRPGTE